MSYSIFKGWKSFILGFTTEDGSPKHVPGFMHTETPARSQIGALILSLVFELKKMVFFFFCLFRHYPDVAS